MSKAIWLVLAYFVVVTNAAFGADEGWVVSGGTSGSYTMNLNGPSDSTQGTFSGSFGRTLGAAEFLAKINYSDTNSGGVATGSTTIGAQLNLVFGNGHLNTFYIGAYYYLSGSSDYGALLGKRFPITGSIAYDQSLSVSMYLTNMPLVITPLQFTLLF